MMTEADEVAEALPPIHPGASMDECRAYVRRYMDPDESVQAVDNVAAAVHRMAMKSAQEWRAAFERAQVLEFDSSDGRKVRVRIEPIRDDTLVHIAIDGNVCETHAWSDSLLAQAFLHLFSERGA